MWGAGAVNDTGFPPDGGSVELAGECEVVQACILKKFICEVQECGRGQKSGWPVIALLALSKPLYGGLW